MNVRAKDANLSRRGGGYYSNSGPVGFSVQG